MSGATKYELISNNNINNNNNIITDFKANFCFVFKTRKSSSFIYGVVLVFVFITIFLAFSPSPWFTNVFSVNTTSQNNTSRSQINYTFQYPFFNASNFLPFNQNLSTIHVPPDNAAKVDHKNTTVENPVHQNNQSSDLTPHTSAVESNQISSLIKNHTSEVQQNANTIKQPQQQIISVNSTQKHDDKIGSTSSPQISSVSPNSSTPDSSNLIQKVSGIGVNSSDFEASLSKNNDKSTAKVKQLVNNELENLVGCDLYDGGWVRDDSYPLYKPGSCKLVDEQFNCVLNGRPDNDYQKLKWKPKACTLPRLNGEHMLKLLKGKRLVFVGDSLNRNMWESLVCILKNSVKNKKHVFEAFGRYSFRTEASYSFVFKDYNCTVEFYVSPFLVQQWEVKNKDGSVNETLRLDLMVRDADEFKNADFLIFNTGHWWTHHKTSRGEDYYQEGSHVYKQLDVTEAFRRAITTWARWVDANVNPQKTHVMFRGYSASHFSGGQWNSGGKCDGETEPIRNDTYLTEYPPKMKVFESVMKGTKVPISYLNVTRMTDYRKDGHPSVYRKQHVEGDEKARSLKYQDCSHWCLPGVPDSWNELLYAELLRKQFKDQRQKIKT